MSISFKNRPIPVIKLNYEKNIYYNNNNCYIKE